MQQVQNLAEAQTLALAVFDTIIDPFIVLDDRIRLVAASRSFYDTFAVEAESARGQSFYTLCGGAWGAPALRELLETQIPGTKEVDGCELSITFAELGERIFVLNARLVASPGDGGQMTLVVMKDITARREIELEKEALLIETQTLLRQQRMLMDEMHHRVANSLQIIASILMLKARAVASEETREHLRDAQQRVISVAEVQAHLHSVDGIDQIEVRPYLTKLCSGLAKSMTESAHPIAIEAVASGGTLTSARAVSFGLIVTELVINAIKYAFPTASPAAHIRVTYETNERSWRLTVADNGIGRHEHPSSSRGLGTAIVEGLAKQLGGVVSMASTPEGLTVSLKGVPESVVQ